MAFDKFHEECGVFGIFGAVEASAQAEGRPRSGTAAVPANSERSSSNRCTR